MVKVKYIVGLCRILHIFGEKYKDKNGYEEMRESAIGG